MINAELEEVRPTSLARYDMGLATVIGRLTEMQIEMHPTMQRLRIWDLKVLIHSSADKSLLILFCYL